MDEYLMRQLTKEQIDRIEKGEPIQKVINQVDFYGYPIEIDLNVICPSLDTEELVSKTLNNLYGFDNPRIVDIGTGSGCIAIAIAKEKRSIVEAVDINRKALDIASKNASNNGADVRFIEGDLLTPLTGKYDCIVSNPPYISYNMDSITVTNNTPILALYAGAEGVASYDMILSGCKNLLNEKYLIAFEIGEGQAGRVTELANKYLPGSRVWTEKDMDNKERFLFIRER